MMKMYSNSRGTSPYSRKGLIVLEEKGLAYEQINTPPHDLPEGFGKLNPNLRVSLLIDGDKRIFESDNIVDYLLRAYPGCKSPEGEPPLAESVTRPDHHIEDAMVLVTLQTILDNSIHIMIMATGGMDPVKVEPHGWVWARDHERIQSCLDWLEQRATPEGFVPGTFSVMDINLICALAFNERYGLHEFENNPFPYPWRNRNNLAAIFDRFQSRPSVQASLPPPTST